MKASAMLNPIDSPVPRDPMGRELREESEPAPLRFAEIRLETDVRLHYAEQGATSGRPVILLHGYSDSWFSFSRILPLLPAELRVFALDLRGHGDSEKPAAGYGMANLAADVIAFIGAKDLQGVTVVGHSLGSFVAQQVAASAGDRVERLVLIDSTTTPRAIEGIHDLRDAVHGLTDPVPSSFVREFQVSTLHLPIPTNFLERVIDESLKLPARVWQSLMDGMLTMEGVRALVQNPIPTLIVWGDRDTFSPRLEQDALAAMLPNAVLKIYADTGHALHWERPAEFARDLVSFMDAVPVHVRR